MTRSLGHFAVVVGLPGSIKQENIVVAVRRGGRVVDGSGLENRQSASSRGFESHPLRGNHASGMGIRVLSLNPSGKGEIRTPFDRRGALRAGFKAKLQLRSQSAALGNPTPSAT